MNIEKSVFVNLAQVLVDRSVNLEFESDFEHWKEHQEIKYTNVPYIGSGMYNGRDGFYFKKRGYSDWEYLEEEAIRSVHNMIIDGYRVEIHDIQDVESDDDRLWNASFGFFLEKI